MKKYVIALILSIIIMQGGGPLVNYILYNPSYNIYQAAPDTFSRALDELQRTFQEKGIEPYVYGQIVVLYDERYGSSITCMISYDKKRDQLYLYRYQKGHWTREKSVVQYNTQTPLMAQNLQKLSTVKRISLSEEYKHFKKPNESGHWAYITTVIFTNSSKIYTKYSYKEDKNIKWY